MHRAVFSVLVSAFLEQGCVTIGEWSAESPSMLRFEGYVEEPTAVEFFEKVTPSTRQIVITSGGGDAKTAMRIGEYIASHQIDIVVEGRCVSSCANYLFLAAKNKTVRPGAWLGFHGGADSVSRVEIEQMLEDMKLPANQRDAVVKQLEDVKAKQDQFFRAVPGGTIVSRSGSIADEKRTREKLKASGFRRFAWLPTREELEKAGVKNIASFWIMKNVTATIQGRRL